MLSFFIANAFVFDNKVFLLFWNSTFFSIVCFGAFIRFNSFFNDFDLKMNASESENLNALLLLLFVSLRVWLLKLLIVCNVFEEFVRLRVRFRKNNSTSFSIFNMFLKFWLNFETCVRFNKNCEISFSFSSLIIRFFFECWIIDCEKFRNSRLFWREF